MQCFEVIDFIDDWTNFSNISLVIKNSIERSRTLTTSEEQIEWIKEISSFLLEPSVVCDEKKFIITLLAKYYFKAHNKHPVRKTISRILVSSKEHHNDIIKKLSEILEHSIHKVEFNEDQKTIMKVINSVNGCFENFFLSTEAVKQSVTIVLPFLIKSLDSFINILSLLQSTQTKADIVINIHIVCQSLVSVLTQSTFIIPEEDIFSLMKYCYYLINESTIPIDTKCNCGIILVASAKHLKGNSGWIYLMKMCNDDLIDICWSDFKFNTIEQKICICYGLLNTKLIKDISESSLESDPPIVEISKTLFDIIEEPSTKISTDMLLVLSRSIFLITNNLMFLSPIHRNSILKYCLKYIWAHLEHYVDTVRHIVKSTFANIVKISVKLKKNGDTEPLAVIKKDISLLPKNQSSFYICLGILGAEDCCEDLFNFYPDIVSHLLNSLNNNCLSSYVSSTYEELMKCFLKRSTVASWTQIWILPVLMNLSTKTDSMNVLLSLLAKTIGLHPDIGDNILAHFDQNTISDPGVLLACIKVIRKKGYSTKLSHNDSNCKWRGLLDKNVLKKALCHKNDQIRLMACGVIVEAHKSTEIFLKDEFSLLLMFIKYNMNVQEPSVRQQIIAYIKKVFVRIAESYAVIERSLQHNNKVKAGVKQINNTSSKSIPESKNILSDIKFVEKASQKQYYQEFVLELKKILLENLFLGANFNRRVSALEMLRMMRPVFKLIFGNISYLKDEYEAKCIFHNLSDSFEHNKILVVDILSDCPSAILFFDNQQTVRESIQQCIQLASSIKPVDCITAAYYLQILLEYPVTTVVLQHLLENNKDDDPYLLAILLLLKELNEQLQIAKSNLIIAAGDKPLYGVLFCIRYLFQIVMKRNKYTSENWNGLITSVINISFELSNTVIPIVNNPSPEGYFPENDFQSEIGLPVTAQMVLLCAWRTIKEVSLLLGEIALNVPIQQDDLNEGIINETHLINIGNHFMTLLCETKHRGAFEQAYVGFTKLSCRLWKCHSETLSQLPKIWLQNLISGITTNDSYNSKLCPTRRSAGVPFMVQALVTTELQVGLKPICFEQSMETLLKVASCQNDNLIACTHSMNILRALFRQTELGEFVTKYVAEGVQIAIQGISGHTWAVRNAATLLFSSLMTRIFGVQRSKDTDALSARNKMTVRVFFLRYPSLYNFLLKELESACIAQNTELLGLSLYPILLLLARLYPSILEGNESQSKIEAFIPFIIECSKNNVMKTRNLAAKAIIPLISNENTLKHTSFLLSELSNNSILKNCAHGFLLQLLYIFQAVPANSIDINILFTDIIKTKWIIEQTDDICYIIMDTYCQILSEIVLKFNIINCELVNYVQQLYYIIDERSTISKSKSMIGIYSYDWSSIRLQFYILNILKLEDLQMNVKQFVNLISSKLKQDNNSYNNFIFNFLICLFEVDGYLIEEEEISNKEILFVKSMNSDLKRELKCSIIKDDDIFHLLRCKLEKDSLDISKFYLVAGFFIQTFNTILDVNITLKKLIEKCYLVHDSVSSSILYYISHIIKYSFKDKKNLNCDVASELCDLFFYNSCPEANYSCRCIVASILVENKNIIITNEYIKGLNNCTLWVIAMMLIEDMERSIRDRITFLILESDYLSQFYSEVVRKKLVKLCLETTEHFNSDYCVALLLLWLLRDNKTQEEDVNEEGRVFDKGEVNVFAEDMYLAKYAYEYLKLLLNRKNLMNSQQRCTYILNILKQSDISVWLSKHVDAGKKILENNLNNFISNKVLQEDVKSESIQFINNMPIIDHKLYLLQKCILNV